MRRNLQAALDWGIDNQVTEARGIGSECIFDSCRMQQSSRPASFASAFLLTPHPCRTSSCTRPSRDFTLGDDRLQDEAGSSILFPQRLQSSASDSPALLRMHRHSSFLVSTDSSAAVAGSGPGDATLGTHSERKLPGLVFKGDAGGDASAAATSSQADHGAQMAVDGRPDTYWASQFNPLKHGPVFVTMEFPAPRQVKGLRIDWEYPASSFEVQLKDGDRWVKFHDQAVNAQPESTVYGNASMAKAIRVVMKAVDPNLGLFQGQQVLGIRGIDIL